MNGKRRADSSGPHGLEYVHVRFNYYHALGLRPITRHTKAYPALSCKSNFSPHFFPPRQSQNEEDSPAPVDRLQQFAMGGGEGKAFELRGRFPLTKRQARPGPSGQNGVEGFQQNPVAGDRMAKAKEGGAGGELERSRQGPEIS